MNTSFFSNDFKNYNIVKYLLLMLNIYFFLDLKNVENNIIYVEFYILN